ncbi:MAG TPA: TPM domain-containing protein, partial [Longimicrobium sp.]|nr:TPM domain-containing protein [Longimicrobium sp.]
MRFPRRWAAAGGVALACALAATPVRAQLQLPPPVGYVNDFAHVIDPAYRDSIQAVIDEVRAKSGGEIVVVTLPSLQGRSEDEVALQIGREWKVGQKGEPGDPMRNTGTVVLVSMQDQKWKIETGDRTITFITAAEAGRIGRDLLVPELRRGNVGRGIYLAVLAVAEKYAQQFRFQLSPTVQPPAPQYQPAEPDGGGGRQRGGSGQLVIFILFILVLLLTRGRIGCLPLLFMGGGGGGRGGGWGGGGFGGGGGGGGFGGFGGGGGF